MQRTGLVEHVDSARLCRDGDRSGVGVALGASRRIGRGESAVGCLNGVAFGAVRQLVDRPRCDLADGSGEDIWVLGEVARARHGDLELLGREVELLWAFDDLVDVDRTNGCLVHELGRGRVGARGGERDGAVGRERPLRRLVLFGYVTHGALGEEWQVGVEDDTHGTRGGEGIGDDGVIGVIHGAAVDGEGELTHRVDRVSCWHDRFLRNDDGAGRVGDLGDAAAVDDAGRSSGSRTVVGGVGGSESGVFSLDDLTGRSRRKIWDDQWCERVDLTGHHMGLGGKPVGAGNGDVEERLGKIDALGCAENRLGDR